MADACEHAELTAKPEIGGAIHSRASSGHAFWLCRIIRDVLSGGGSCSEIADRRADIVRGRAQTISRRASCGRDATCPRRQQLWSGEGGGGGGGGGARGGPGGGGGEGRGEVLGGVRDFVGKASPKTRLYEAGNLNAISSPLYPAPLTATTMY